MKVGLPVLSASHALTVPTSLNGSRYFLIVIKAIWSPKIDAYAVSRITLKSELSRMTNDHSFFVIYRVYCQSRATVAVTL